MKTQIANLTLATRKENYFSWMERQAKIERINRTNMPYKMRLNAMITADNRKGKQYS